MSDAYQSRKVVVKHLFPLKIKGIGKKEKVVKRAFEHEPMYYDALLADDATSDEIENYAGLIEYKDRKKKK